MMQMQFPSIVKPLLILAGGAVLLTVMHFAASFLIPVLLAIFFATLLTPIYSWLKKRRIPKALALLLSIGLLVLIAFLLALLVGQSLAVLESSLASYRDQFSQRQAELAEQLEALNPAIDLTPLLTALDPGGLVDTLSFLLNTVAGLLKNSLLILLLTIFLLVEAPLFKMRMVQAFGADHSITQNVITIARIMISYFGLRAVVNLVNAIATGLMLWLFGIDYAGLWAVLIFFLSFIPYIGAIVSMIPPILLAYAQSGLGLAIIIGLLAVVINAISENILQPMVMGISLSVSPTVVFLSAMFWVFILGGPGAFLAMPLTMALILFLQNFAETRSFAAMLITTPEPSTDPAPNHRLLSRFSKKHQSKRIRQSGYESPPENRLPGNDAGKVNIAPDFEEPLPKVEDL
jgi:predicted PurR-regulated permease PerM